jgi:hypothetical protein
MSKVKLKDIEKESLNDLSEKALWRGVQAWLAGGAGNGGDEAVGIMHAQLIAEREADNAKSKSKQ